MHHEEASDVPARAPLGGTIMSSHQPPFQPERDDESAPDSWLEATTRPALSRRPAVERGRETPITGSDDPTVLTPHTPAQWAAGHTSLPPPELPPVTAPTRRGVSRRMLLAGAGAVGFGALGAGIGLALSSRGGQHGS